MNILSLFDGVGGARIALDKSKISFNNYFSSEIDHFALKVLNDNYDDIIHVGDIRGVKQKNLPKIDLIIGGSPCQDLSNAQKGKGLKGGNSSLFYEFIRVLNEFNPKYFLLENVKNKWADLMSEIIGVDYIEINSQYFTGQFRPRYYWTNIPINPNTIPKKLNNETIKDILDSGADKKYFLKDNISEKIIKTINKDKNHKGSIKRVITASKELINDLERQRRIYDINGKSPTLLARSDTTKILINNRIRKLSPLECERLQGLPDNYTSSCSDTQRYKMIGNGFTVDVISFILNNLNQKPKSRKISKNLDKYLLKNEIRQLDLYE